MNLYIAIINGGFPFVFFPEIKDIEIGAIWQIITRPSTKPLIIIAFFIIDFITPSIVDT